MNVRKNLDTTLEREARQEKLRVEAEKDGKQADEAFHV
jgi:hypothetical protein